MQAFEAIVDSTTITASRQKLLDNDNTARSNHAGTAFPTTELLLGMLCWRTDQTKLYVLKSIGPDVWSMLFDATKTAIHSEEVAAGYQPLDADLTAVAALGTTGVVERTGSGTFGTYTISTYGKTITAVADAAAARTVIGAAAASHTHTFANISDKKTADVMPASLGSGDALRSLVVNATYDAYIIGHLSTISTSTPSGGNDGDIWYQY